MVKFLGQVISVDGMSADAQAEKEALGLTWGCERFRDFLIGRHFHLETDHKPLVSLLGTQALTELPPRIQRFRLRLMSYNYTILHEPGKSLHTADMVSHVPVSQTKDLKISDTNLTEDTNISIHSVLDNLPATPTYLTKL